MLKIDLFSESGKDAGASPDEAGFVVTEPWGAYILPDVKLARGWYELKAGQENDLLLILEEIETFLKIELHAAAAGSIYVHLSGGRYRLSVLGGRPGIYNMLGSTFRVLSTIGRYRLLCGRLIQALCGSMSLKNIAALVKRAASKSQTYGVRANPGNTAGAGSVNIHDLEKSGYSLNAEVRLGQMTNGPVFLIIGHDGGPVAPDAYSGQIYRRFTLDARDSHDFVVTLDSTERLLPDGLLLLAEHISKHPDSRIVVMDRWEKGRPTIRIAWDPLMYATSGLPTPFAVARGFECDISFENQSMFSIVDVPVSETEVVRQVPVSSHVKATARPECSIIIPTRDNAALLSGCLKGLFENTDWPHEVIIVDNGSEEDETFALFESYKSKGLRVLRCDFPFNFSTLCNEGAAIAKYDYLLFLNNDVVLHRSDWLAEMMAYAMLAPVGAVGARLLYPDARLQHGGVMLGLTQMCGHLWRGLGREAQDTFPQLLHSSLRSAVTGACLCVSRKKFDDVGRFDEQLFPVTLNDVDLCLKLLKRGFLNIYASQAEAYHLESESRGADETPEKKLRRQEELKAFFVKWGMTADPWMSRAISRASESFGLR